MPRIQSRVRKLLGASSNAEGWAHYCEQMMLDEGFSKDPKMRLGQLQDALLRDARYIVGIEMHTGKLTFDQAIDFFVKEGYQPHEVGVVETKRGTADATYLYYTLGKLQILKLREDYRKMRGSQFSLEEFHDKFLQQDSSSFARQCLATIPRLHGARCCPPKPLPQNRHRCFAAVRADVQLVELQPRPDLFGQAEVQLITLRSRVGADLLDVLHRVSAHPDFYVEGTRNLFQRQHHSAIFAHHGCGAAKCAG